MTTPLAALAAGLVAGVGGTLAMTAYQELVGRLRDGGEGDPVPAEVGKRVLEGVFRREVADRHLPLLNHAVHWSYATAWGGGFAVWLAPSCRR